MIELDDAAIAIDGRYLFRQMNWRLGTGEVLAVLGRNGSGKTTLLRAILGLRPWSEGHARLDGIAGYVPQGISATFNFTVMEVVLTGRARHLGMFRSPGARDIEIARRALSTLGLAEFEARRIAELSGGERQMVFVARALAAECDILVLDEPTSSLDYRNQQVIISLLRRLSSDQALTILFSSHYPQHALLLADHVLMLDGHGGYFINDVNTAMTEERLSTLYGVRMRRFDLAGDGSHVVPALRSGGLAPQ